MDKFSKLLEKKKKKSGELSENEVEAKSAVLGDLRDMASKAMSEKIHGLKKVSVAAESPDGLKAGLEKAKELVEQLPSKDEEESEEEMSLEEIDAKIKELLALKEQLQSEEE